MTQTVLILGGSGKIGSNAANAFWNAGWQVRHYDRKTGDMTAAAMGADLIVNGLNPPNYANWAKNIPVLTAQVIAAARASGATVILPGNIYNFGKVDGEIREDSPQTPNSRKGQIRKEMEATYRASGVQVITLRAGNFLDPVGNGDFSSLVYLRDIRRGRITLTGPEDAKQAYAFVPDWARAAVMLAEKREALPRNLDLNFPGHTLSGADWRDAYERLLGKPLKTTHFPWWLMTLASPVWELAREMREMRYLYEMSHWLGGAKFSEVLPEFSATPLDDVLASLLPADIHPDKTVRARSQPVAAK